MIVLTTAYNCEKYVEKCLLSIMGQKFKDFKCYITDDMSTDNTVKIIQETIKNDNRFVLIQNKEKLYQGGNYDQVIRGLNIDDEEICVEVDGDDWLPSSSVFSKINEVYSDDKIWITSGSFKYSDGRKGFANPPLNFENIRNQTFTLSHLRTWKSWLWKRIKEEDLKDENGDYWGVAGDLSFMFPMFEMSGEKHYLFINDILYIYNETNPINDHKVNMTKVSQTTNKIRNKIPYNLIQ
jgi:glycosyltransferase involved in cell wall biosynthesis